MTLRDVIGNLDRYEDDQIMCTKRPWTASSECVVAHPDDDLAVPVDVRTEGFEYFLEVHIAREVLEVLVERDVALDRRVSLLIHYAEHDAYPDWIHDGDEK